MSFQRVMVVGAGQMGSGIAQVAAQAGCDVILQDIKEEYTERGMRTIATSLNRFVKKGQLTEEESAQILKRITPTTEIEMARNAEIVIEAATEQMAIKKEIFKKLDEFAPQQTLLATNTSSLPVTELAAVTKRPDQVIGMHFMNPVPMMKLVEVIRGLQTSDEVFQAVMNFSEELGKKPVAVQDFPGFISNRVLMPMINEAVYCLYEGVAEPQAIDEIMKLGMNHPMGPLQLADFIGLDTCLYIMEVLYDGFGDSKYRPCPLLRKYVAAGWLGKKTGRGFYVYE
ncbi:3-hydroxybutyryl-CoA dehydrogenase [Sulfoacidibacillus thermotolerans]|uniref:3-hydroxybutyryl-CoA dehydrogenase n=1 Tax=Sulfoacidibacillus thermotolerans TaxID=1765684 RepID=A0A2U3D9P9_SULT2|nr:3-hydroxybutyryl-CoA dehydrogenase [Sulfoacidibacillus thermotolerans]PWI58009.1 3-hydroxybutyryl-CoA dehydrogenase [Sulfoacidibacillus thermotolerans]